jgi:hypothetical protein
MKRYLLIGMFLVVAILSSAFADDKTLYWTDKMENKNLKVFNVQIREPQNGDPDYYIVGNVKNKSDKTFHISISFKLYDSDGAVVNIARDSTDDIAPGDVWKFKALIGTSTTASYKFSKLEYWEIRDSH